MEEKELLNILVKANEECDKKIDSVKMSDFDSLKEFMDYIEKVAEPVNQASRKYRLVQTPVLTDIDPDNGEVFTIDEFIETCESRQIIDSDGFGYYMKEGKNTNIYIQPGDVIVKSIRKDCDGVIWFNK